MASHTPTTKEQARSLLENLPDDATWDDIVYELAARRSIELGLADAEQGRVTDARTVRRELRLRT
jgi:predicted transcriptional regulator